MVEALSHRLIKTQIGHARDFTWYRGQRPSPARVILSHERVQIHSRENLCSYATNPPNFACVSCYCATFRLRFIYARRGRALAAISGKVPSVSGVCIELSKNIKILVTFDLHSRSRDPRWPPNTFFKVKFGPKTTHNSANFWSNSIIFVLFCCWRPVLHFGWKSNTNNGSMCLLAPEKRPSYTTLHYYGKLHCRHFQLRMMGKLIQTVTVPPLISL